MLHGEAVEAAARLQAVARAAAAAEADRAVDARRTAWEQALAALQAQQQAAADEVPFALTRQTPSVTTCLSQCGYRKATRKCQYFL